MCLPSHAHSTFELNSINTCFYLSYRPEFLPTVNFRNSARLWITAPSTISFFHSSHDNFLVNKGEAKS